ncbi:hypothetical protein [Devosia sp. LC5]|uniref:hypothetical protein n=1 Tax=Devosia sp. LC5 TaxID=1502724 RepID=UPI00126906E8|nr:hypothetical protein [Devosia sp. LC5]
MAALMASSTIPEAQQGLRVIWYAMSAIAWTYPIMLLVLTTPLAPVSRPMLGLIALFNVTQALFHMATGLLIDAAGQMFLALCLLHAAVGVLALLARPPHQAEALAPAPRGNRLVVFCIATGFTALVATYHTVIGTLQLWPAELLASDITSSPRQLLYAMWLFSCVLFLSIPSALLWSLRAPAAAGRFVLMYIALLAATVMVSWISTKALGLSPELLPIGPPVAFGLIIVLTLLSAPSRLAPSFNSEARRSV